jgi:hypothetical protein
MLRAMKIAEAVEAYKSGAFSAAAFRRFLVSYDKWKAEKQGDVLALRSDAGAAGAEAFSAIDDVVQRVTIDPGAPHAFEIAQAEIQAFREIAAAVSVERAWQRLADGDERPEDLAQVARFAAYHVTAVRKPEGHLLIHVPHDDGGMFVPLFTHRDALEIALEEFRRNFPPDAIACTEAPGARLFPPLANEKADGIVINYLGPTKPQAFCMDVVPLILDALEEPR